MKNYKITLCSFIMIVILLFAGCDGTDTNNDVFSYSDGIDKNGFHQGISALDYVEDFNYTGLLIPRETHQISDEAIQEELSNVLSAYLIKDQIITDRAVVYGDTLNIDYIGSVDGVELESLSTGGEGREVAIGIITLFDDNYLDQLIGHMPGETLNVQVTFPEDFEDSSLQGKKAVMVTTINHIIGDVMPQLTDDFVKTNLSADYGWENVEEMKNNIQEDLQKEAIQQYVTEYLMNEVPVRTVPDKMIKYQEKAMIQDYKELAENSNIDYEQFLIRNAGVNNEEELIEISRDDNFKNATYYLVLQAVAEDLGFSVNNEDLANFFIKKQGSDDYSLFENRYGLPYLKNIVLCEKALDYIIENAVLA